jgi:hypothetical protein
MSRRRRQECPTPSKTAFLEVEDAAAAYREELGLYLIPGQYRARWAYRCVCRKWHRTGHPIHSLPFVDLQETSTP